MSEMPKPTEEFREVPASIKEAHEEALGRFEDINTREQWSRRLGVEDLIFSDQDGGQWDQFQSFGFNADTNRGGDSDPPPPRYQNDKISPIIEQSVEDQRRAQIDIRVRPTGKNQKGLAHTFNGLIKNIETVSEAQDAYDCGYDEVQRSGYGGWRVVTEYSDDSFNQSIGIESIKCATGSLFFGPSNKYTKEDALYAFYVWHMDKEEFKATYPEAQTTDWPDAAKQRIQGTSAAAWFDFNNNLIQLAEYWRKRPITREIVQLVDGRIVDADALPVISPPTPELAQAVAQRGLVLGLSEKSTPENPLYEIPVAINRVTDEEMRRKVKSYEVERFVMNGSEILKGPQKWAGKYIPLVPCYGIVSNILGQEIVRGRVRKGKDAQRAYNYAYSQAIEVASNSPKDFFWLTPEMASGDNVREGLENMNTSQNPVNFYTHDPDVPQGPVKAPGPVVQEALLTVMQKSEQDIFTSIGGGATPQDATAADNRSGEAVKEQRIDQEKGQSVYFSNYIKSRQYTGKILVDLIPRIYTTQQQVRIIKPDGSEDFVTVNEPDIDLESAEKQTVMDLSQAKFDVTVDVGPAYASQRESAQEKLKELAVESPIFAELTSDLLAKNMDIPGSDEIYERIRKRMAAAGIIDLSEEEMQEMGITRDQQIAAQLEPQIREQILQELNVQLIQANTARTVAETDNYIAASQQKEVEAVTNLQGAQLDNEQKFEEIQMLKLDQVNKSIEGFVKYMEGLEKKLAMVGSLNLGDIDNANSQTDLIEEQQQEVSPGPNSQQSQEFNI